MSTNQDFNKQVPQSCTMVVFGISGDLAKRKLVPALFNLMKRSSLPEKFKLVGFSRKEVTDEEFRTKLNSEYRPFLSGATGDASSLELWNTFVSRATYCSGNFDDAQGYERLKKSLAASENVLFYLATPPEYFLDIAQNLARVGLLSESQGVWRRLVVEKPFGRDLESAKNLNRQLREILQEKQIFRIDHYLGKETVQNIMVLRFSNGIFEPIWNRNFIESVDIVVAETLGVESRGGYYESAGALRDMVPNHLFQLLSLVGMEPPSSFDADAVRDEKAKLVESIRPLTQEEVLTSAIRGQYGAGKVDGKLVPAYRDEEGVNPHSDTETYAALRLSVENWRWAGVPFVLKTGKRLAERVSEVRIRFKRGPLQLFRETGLMGLSNNELYLQIQPEERIAMRFGVKLPGTKVKIGQVEMNFDYGDAFGRIPNTGYETLIYDCMVGDATLFQRSDQVESAWAVVQPVLDVWKALPARQFPNYRAGGWGPEISHLETGEASAALTRKAV